MCKSEDYKIFFDDAPVALCRTNIHTGEFEMANKAAAEMLGCASVEELIENHKSTDFYPQEIRKKLIKILRKQAVVEDYEVELHLPNGKTVWVRANFRLNCGGECLECFLTDISEIIHLRDRQLTEMVDMSHKLDSRIAVLAG